MGLDGKVTCRVGRSERQNDKGKDKGKDKDGRREQIETDNRRIEDLNDCVTTGTHR
jgi:hypothetical protein